jgi:hypothetical protein
MLFALCLSFLLGSDPDVLQAVVLEGNGLKRPATAVLGILLLFAHLSGWGQLLANNKSRVRVFNVEVTEER